MRRTSTISHCLDRIIPKLPGPPRRPMQTEICVAWDAPRASSPVPCSGGTGSLGLIENSYQPIQIRSSAVLTLITNSNFVSSVSMALRCCMRS
jgi:hypothetical protein